jgi:hypothetical protein
MAAFAKELAQAHRGCRNFIAREGGAENSKKTEPAAKRGRCPDAPHPLYKGQVVPAKVPRNSLAGFLIRNSFGAVGRFLS